MRMWAAVSLLLALCCWCAPAQSPPKSNPGPVEAELLKPLNLRSLTNGKTVFAQVTRDWNGSDCVLRKGATLEATVEMMARRKGRNPSRLALSFTRAQCGGPEMKPMRMLLAAVARAPQVWDNLPDALFKLPVTSINASLNPATGQLSFGTGDRYGGFDIGGFSPWHAELRGIEHHFPMSPKVQAGDVIDIKGMKLELGTGPNRSSVLSRKGRDVVLDAYTQVLLVPFSMLVIGSDLHQSPSSIGTESPAAPPPPSALTTSPPPDELDVCAPPGCAVDLPTNPQVLPSADAASIPVRPLGYIRRPNMNLGDFTEDDALIWLGTARLLFTFNPHPLIHREGVTNSRAPRRVIRAVLLDTEHHTVIRAMDWAITDLGRYLWPLPGNRILVHVGNEVRVYDAQLEIERTLVLTGPLAFLRLSPNGGLAAVATLRERHTPELHAKLRDELFREPEEDLDITILDANLKVLAWAPGLSGFVPPTLLNEGQVVLLSQPDNHYRLALNGWSGKPSTLGRLKSSCTPEISSVAPDLLFLLTCDTSTNHTVYSVLRADGKLLLRGESNSHESGQDVAGTWTGGMFAIKTVHARRDLFPGMDFRGEELDFQEVRVYRAADGKRLVNFRIDHPSTSHGGYALAPDGSQLAVLSGSQIRFFPLSVP